MISFLLLVARVHVVASGCHQLVAWSLTRLQCRLFQFLNVAHICGLVERVIPIDKFVVRHGMDCVLYFVELSQFRREYHSISANCFHGFIRSLYKDCSSGGLNNVEGSIGYSR